MQRTSWTGLCYCHSLRILWPNCVWSMWSESECARTFKETNMKVIKTPKFDLWQLFWKGSNKRMNHSVPFTAAVRVAPDFGRRFWLVWQKRNLSLKVQWIFVAQIAHKCRDDELQVFGDSPCGENITWYTGFTWFTFPFSVRLWSKKVLCKIEKYSDGDSLCYSNILQYL